MLVMLRRVQIRWTRTWAEKGGRARPAAAAAPTAPEADLIDYGGPASAARIGLNGGPHP